MKPFLLRDRCLEAVHLLLGLLNELLHGCLLLLERVHEQLHGVLHLRVTWPRSLTQRIFFGPVLSDLLQAGSGHLHLGLDCLHFGVKLLHELRHVRF